MTEPTAPNRAAPPGLLPALVGAVFVLAGFYLQWTLTPASTSDFAYAWRIFGPVWFDPMFGFAPSQLAQYAARLLLLGPGCLLLTAALVARRRIAPPSPELVRRGAVAAAIVAVLVAGGVLFGVLRGRATVDDELTYRHQATLLAEGRLADDTLPPMRHGREFFTVNTERGLTGKYLFGEPLVQVPGTALGWPALAHLPLAALTLLAWYAAVRARAGEVVAGWATILLALSPMFVLTTATGLSQPTSLAAIAVAGLGLSRLHDGRRDGAALVGGGLAFALAVRPQTAVPIGAVLGTAALITALRRRDPVAVLLLVGLAGAGALAVAAYDDALTGRWSSPPLTLFRPRERYGFGEVFEYGSTFVHTPWTAARNLLVTAVRFNAWWLGWPASLALVGVWWAVGRPWRGLGTWALAGGALVAFQVPYYCPGTSDTGPIYYYELLLPASLLGALALPRALERWPTVAPAALLVHFVVGTGTFVVDNTLRLHRLVTAIHAPADAVVAALPDPSLLIVESALDEGRPVGWVWSPFPYRWRSDADPIVVWPDSDPAFSAALRRRYADRACFYLRRPPPDGAPELSSCDDAAAWLARDPWRMPGEPP